MSGMPNDDQRFGDVVDLDPGIDVESWGPRGAEHLRDDLHDEVAPVRDGQRPQRHLRRGLDRPTTQDPGPYDDDEINLLEWNNYYGSPNRNGAATTRARTSTTAASPPRRGMAHHDELARCGDQSLRTILGKSRNLSTPCRMRAYRFPVSTDSSPARVASACSTLT